MKAKLENLLTQAEIQLTDRQKYQLIQLVQLLNKWNKAYNLTSVRDPQEMLVKHILDSIVVSPYLQGDRFIDVGTGPGLPGLPLAIIIPVAERLGNEVIEFVNVSKSFGDKVLIDDLSFKVPAGAIVGIIGPNGAGKSTLFKMIAGKEQPDSGEVKIGQTVKMSLIDQSREGLQNDKTVFDNIAEGRDILQVGQFEIPARQYLGRFNFKGSDQSKIAGQLSGGERGRLHLAKTLLSGGNVLLLDEPSNDLDVETLRALEDALLEFAGSVMVISHDRWFLDRIATHILACEGDSKWVFFDGNYQEYEADKKRRLGEEGAKPKRITYIDQLLAEGKAYKSYVTEEELAAERERQEAAGETPRYINEYLGMSEEEKAAYIAEREAAGVIPTVRLAVNESGIYKWHDMVTTRT